MIRKQKHKYNPFKEINIIIIVLLWSVQLSQAQCPRGLHELTIPPAGDLDLYLPLDNNADNFGSGNYSTTLSGAVFVEAKCNEGLEFDGVNDYLLITPTLNLVDDFTITAWIRPYDQSEPMSIFSIREQCTSTYRGYSMAQFGINVYSEPLLSNQVNVHQNCSGFSGGDRYINPNISFIDNEDVFVAVTVQNNSSENRIVKLYVDCQEYTTELTIDFSTAVSFDSAREYITTIGASSNVSDFYNSFDGIIDELRVYTKALDRQSLLDVYFQCMPLEIESTDNLSCTQDSIFITIHNTEPDVEYHLIDVANSQQILNTLDGNCNTITFSIGPLAESAAFQIQVESLLSGCVITLDTTINVEPFTDYVYEEENYFLCFGDSVLVEGDFVFSDISVVDTFYSVDACDTILTDNYIFFPYINIDYNYSMCEGDSILFGTEFLSIGGLYEYINEDCDTLYSMNLSVIEVIEIDRLESVCQGDSILFNGIYISTPDTYEAIFQNQFGCDTIITLELVEIDIPITELQISICQGDSILLFDEYVMFEGLYNYNEISLRGCDSTISVQLHILPYIRDTTEVQICRGDSLLLFGNYIMDDGIYNDTIVSTIGCDTVLSVNLSSVDTFFTYIVEYICEGDSILFDDWIFNEGVYTNSYVSAGNCDSIVALEILFLEIPPIFSLPDITINDVEVVGIDLNIDLDIWSISWTPSGIVDCDTCSIINLFPTQSTEMNVSLINDDGCIYEHEFNVNVLSVNTFNIPNIFSPNNDGFNDEFNIGLGQLENFSIMIYDRWGNLVYSSIDDTRVSWDGTYNGNYAAIGVYAYVLSYKNRIGNVKYIAGDVTLIR